MAAWRKEEDDMLTSLVDQTTTDTRDWVLIASKFRFPVRSPDECEQRYAVVLRNYLSPPRRRPEGVPAAEPPKPYTAAIIRRDASKNLQELTETVYLLDCPEHLTNPQASRHFSEAAKVNASKLLYRLNYHGPDVRHLAPHPMPSWRSNP